MRGICGFASTILLYSAVELIPLSLAVTLFYASPIVTSILSFFCLNERLAKLEIVSIFSSMFGVILLT
jgi:drug/metabolite transporter (DMT)-like permease